MMPTKALLAISFLSRIPLCDPMGLRLISAQELDDLELVAAVTLMVGSTLSLCYIVSIS